MGEGAAVASPSALSRKEAQEMLDLLKGELASSVEGIRREVAGCCNHSGFGVRRLPLQEAIGPLGVAASDMQLTPNWGGVTVEPIAATKLNNIQGKDPPNNQELAELAHSFSQKLSTLEQLVNGAFVNALRECGPWMLRNLRHSLQRNLQLSQEHAPSEGPQDPKAVPGLLDTEGPSLEKAWKQDLDEFMGMLRCELERAAGQCAREEFSVAMEPLKQELTAANLQFRDVQDSLHEWVMSEFTTHSQCTAELIDRAAALNRAELADLAERGTRLAAAIVAHGAQLPIITERVERVEKVTAPTDRALLRLAEQLAQVEGVLNPQATEVLRISQRVTAIEGALAPQGGGIVRARGAAPMHGPSLEEPKSAGLHRYRGEPLS